MATPATIEKEGASRGRRAAARVRLNLDVAAISPGGEETRALVHDLSASGLLLETEAALSLGSKVIVALPDAGDVAARVVWHSENLFGCRFDEPLGRAALGAAQLRNPIPRDLQLAERSDEPPAPERPSERLLRLRQERGLSRSELAIRVGVSTPSVWAWEVGKATPRDNHLLALAKAFGIAESELRPRLEARDSNSERRLESAGETAGAHGSLRLQNLLDQQRAQIAALLGVAVDKVRIVVEF